MTVKLEQRLPRGLSYIVSYTRSRLRDDASSVFDASILTGPVANYPVADSFNRRSSATTRPATSRTCSSRRRSGICRWHGPRAPGPRRARRDRQRLDRLAIVTLQSGIPVAVTQTTNFNAFAGFGTQRPNLVGDPELPADERSPSRWFNTAAFAVAPQFTLGSASRNPVRGPSYRNVDLALSRRVPVPGQYGARAARRGVQPAQHAAVRQPERACSAPPTSARSPPRATRASFSSP